MSVRWGDVQVENVDADTLRVTWVGLPVDAEIRLQVKAKGDGFVLAFTQPAPPKDSDAVGFDRVLVLDFASAVRSQDVQATFATAS
jgi:class 3 adenylate cyclase